MFLVTADVLAIEEAMMLFRNLSAYAASANMLSNFFTYSSFDGLVFNQAQHACFSREF
jgi:hypothetical protein